MWWWVAPLAHGLSYYTFPSTLDPMLHLPLHPGSHTVPSPPPWTPILHLSLLPGPHTTPSHPTCPPSWTYVAPSPPPWTPYCIFTSSLDVMLHLPPPLWTLYCTLPITKYWNLYQIFKITTIVMFQVFEWRIHQCYVPTVSWRQSPYWMLWKHP